MPSLGNIYCFSPTTSTAYVIFPKLTPPRLNRGQGLLSLLKPTFHHLFSYFLCFLRLLCDLSDHKKALIKLPKLIVLQGRIYPCYHLVLSPHFLTIKKLPFWEFVKAMSKPHS